MCNRFHRSILKERITQSAMHSQLREIHTRTMQQQRRRIIPPMHISIPLIQIKRIRVFKTGEIAKIDAEKTRMFRGNRLIRRTIKMRDHRQIAPQKPDNRLREYTGPRQ